MKIRILFIFTILTLFAVKSFGQSSEELKMRRASIQREINALQKSLNKTSSSKKLTLKQINSLNAQIRLRQDKINTINSEIGVLDHQISKNKNSISLLQKQLEDLRKKYAAMVQFAQRNQNAYNKLMFIFASKDFNQAFMRVKYMQQFGKKRREQADKIVATQTEIKKKIALLNANIKEKSNLLADQQQEKQKLGKEKDNTSVVYNQYKKEERTYINDISQHKKQQATLDRQIRIVIKREIAIAKKKAEDEARRLAAIKAAENAKKAAASGKPVPVAEKVAPEKSKSDSELLRSTPESAKLSADFQNNKGSLPWPVKSGFISEGYGLHSFQGARYNNDGVNIRTSDNASVRAVFSGKVVNVLPITGELVVMISHGEYFTVYTKLRSASVREGQMVTTGQEIGKLGTSENGTEVGFQIWKGATRMNPETWIKR